MIIITCSYGYHSETIMFKRNTKLNAIKASKIYLRSNGLISMTLLYVSTRHIQIYTNKYLYSLVYLNALREWENEVKG